MSFADTYREERLINRRAWARSARILGRLIGFCLTACFVVALRVEPQLRAAVADLALAVMGKTAQQGVAAAEQQAQPPDQAGIATRPRQAAPTAAHLPESRVKVNRGLRD